MKKNMVISDGGSITSEIAKLTNTAKDATGISGKSIAAVAETSGEAVTSAAKSTTSAIKSTGSSVGSNFSDMSKSSWLKWGLIILILAFLGFNIFVYLGKATDETTSFLQPVFDLFKKVTKTTIDKSAEGTKLATNVAAGTVTSGVDVLQKTMDGNKERTSIDEETEETQIDMSSDKPRSPPVRPPSPDDAGSRTQTHPSSAKVGYCFIGEDRGFRSCVSVDDSNKCMSGDIFPTKEQCEHPELRE
jgi:hypothetical protein